MVGAAVGVAVAGVAGDAAVVAGQQVVALAVPQAVDEVGGGGSLAAGEERRGGGEEAQPPRDGAGARRPARSQRAGRWRQVEEPWQAPRGGPPRQPDPCAATRGRSETLGRSRVGLGPGMEPPLPRQIRRLRHRAAAEMGPWSLVQRVPPAWGSPRSPAGGSALLLPAVEVVVAAAVVALPRIRAPAYTSQSSCVLKVRDFISSKPTQVKKRDQESFKHALKGPYATQSSKGGCGG